LPDVVSPEVRSRMMSGIRGKNTKPELAIRKALHGAGFRYRLHVAELPGKPDIVLPRYRAVVLVHGCFWHRHDCELFKWPKSREAFWKKKVEGNRANDACRLSELIKGGWRVMEVWECALKGPRKLSDERMVAKLSQFVEGRKPRAEIRGHSFFASSGRRGPETI
jgi:DNA mismatch endonuclease (patch repair protein)